MKLKFYLDEAGRWPLAGPVLVWCVLPVDNFDTSLFADSKKLSEKKRQKIFEEIVNLENNGKLFYSFGFASNNEIDDFWISKSINLATKRALIVIILKYIYFLEDKIWINGDKLLNIQKLKWEINFIYDNNEKILDYDFSKLIRILNDIEKIHWIMFDGNVDFWLSKDLGFKVISIVKWDDKVPYIWAASIVAKVVRDNYMKKQAEKYPNYLFEKHKWYGTKVHRELIQKFWSCSLHRKSFLKNIIGLKNK